MPSTDVFGFAVDLSVAMAGGVTREGWKFSRAALHVLSMTLETPMQQQQPIPLVRTLRPETRRESLWSVVKIAARNWWQTEAQPWLIGMGALCAFVGYAAWALKDVVR